MLISGLNYGRLADGKLSTYEAFVLLTPVCSPRRNTTPRPESDLGLLVLSPMGPPQPAVCTYPYPYIREITLLPADMRRRRQSTELTVSKVECRRKPLVLCRYTPFTTLTCHSLMLSTNLHILPRTAHLCCGISSLAPFCFHCRGRVKSTPHYPATLWASAGYPQTSLNQYDWYSRFGRAILW